MCAFTLTENMTLISKAEAADSIATDTQAREVRFCVMYMYCTCN